ncbi:MAG: hypothetical protein COB23_04915 [Methylophaga sp.]|nr:MAG: hypothetical protein COB23_04915 [Methylophaga sp.]
MYKLKLVSLLLALFMTLPLMAFSTNDERVDHYLDILANSSQSQQIQMLNRLQWSGITDPRLFDVIVKSVQESNWASSNIKLSSYMIRALGYSGNEKYYAPLEQLSDTKSPVAALRRHAKKALQNLSQFTRWNKALANNKLIVEGKSVEVTTYLKMLDVNDVFVQRLAARAMYHEHQKDPDLLASAAEKLKTLYTQPGLDREAQDTAAWLCKAIGQSGQAEYIELLHNVANETPYPKIKKYAMKFAR